jgi:hypothetical protein
MVIGGRVATWLDLAAAREWGRGDARLRVHAVGGRKEGCYALSLDGRWLCASDGTLTVFRGVDAAARFLKTARLDAFEPGEAPPDGVRCDGGHHGMCIGRNGRLVGCRESGLVPEFNG